MKKYKKAMSFVLALIIAMSVGVSAFAEGISPRYFPCPEGGKHQMSPLTLGVCYSGSSFENPGPVEFAGTVSQCYYCKIYMLSTNYPGSGTASTVLGNVAVNYQVGVIGGAVAMVGGSIGYYTTLTQDDFIKGFNFAGPYSISYNE